MKTKVNYQEYLASREWAQRKEAVRARCNGFCERCKVAPYESTHHLTYANKGHEPLEDLLAVCNDCHEYLSAKSDEDPLDHIGYVVVAADTRAIGNAGWPGMLHQERARFAGKILSLDGVLPMTYNPHGDFPKLTEEK